MRTILIVAINNIVCTACFLAVAYALSPYGHIWELHNGWKITLIILWIVGLVVVKTKTD